ncbi:MAG: complex I NDUFA9 subunit family protein [Pirellulaceae bacterium]
MKILVAGASGFLGSHVLKALSRHSHEVLALSRRLPEEECCEFIACDLTEDDLPLEKIRECDAIVNLVGIKRAAGSQGFKKVHVDVTRRLIDAAHNCGIQRFIHISVVASRPDPRLPYHHTKWLAEEMVRESGLDFTILRPAVIYGRGDDMISHLVKMIRFFPVFPVVGRGNSILQPVDVRDVAASVVAALEKEIAIGKSYDVVGPERLALKEVVRRVAEATGLNLYVLPTPIWLQRLAVSVMNRLSKNPLSTPAQLQMLVDGLYGEQQPLQRELGIEPRTFSVKAIRELQAAIPPLFGFSLRLCCR